MERGRKSRIRADMQNVEGRGKWEEGQGESSERGEDRGAKRRK